MSHSFDFLKVFHFINFHLLLFALPCCRVARESFAFFPVLEQTTKVNTSIEREMKAKEPKGRRLFASNTISNTLNTCSTLDKCLFSRTLSNPRDRHERNSVNMIYSSNELLTHFCANSRARLQQVLEITNMFFLFCCDDESTHHIPERFIDFFACYWLDSELLTPSGMITCTFLQ